MRSSYHIIPIIKKINNKRCKTRKIYKTYKKRKTYKIRKTYKTRIKYFGGTLSKFITNRLIKERTLFGIPLGENIQYNIGSYIYTIDTSQLETTHTFTIIRHIDDSKVTIKIPENYPYTAPTIISQLVTTQKTHEILIPNWTPAKNIFKSIFEMLQPASDTSDEQKKYKMLIYCHDMPVNKKEDHYFYDYLATFIEMHYSEITIVDFDIKTLDSNIIGNPDIKVDGFSKTFIANHPDRYDIITLPDCGGIWYTYQLQENTDIPTGVEQQQALVFNIINIFNLLNINGYMILSKFMNINFFYKLYKSFSSEETKYKIIQPIITDTSIGTILIVQKLV